LNPAEKQLEKLKSAILILKHISHNQFPLLFLGQKWHYGHSWDTFTASLWCHIKS